MAIIIDSIELDEDNREFKYASEFVKQTNKLVYLTGKAGTGKTTFLKYLRETTNKSTVILAPTGVAAVNAGGQTIHSFFQIKPSIYSPNDKRLRVRPEEDDDDKSTIYDHFKYFKERLELIRGLELMIIDEISMVRCDLLDVVDILLRTFRKRKTEPFGGVQVVLIGDTFQLPPIAKFDEWCVLEKFYNSPFFFSSKVIENNKPVYIELKKIYRQKEQEFIDLLDRIRISQISDHLLGILNAKYNPTFSPNESENYITLATHNDTVNNINLIKLNQLKAEIKLFNATVEGEFPKKIMPTDEQLKVKEGAQIIFIKNDKAKRYFNGKIAKINSIDEDIIVVELSEGETITVEREEWSNIKFSWNEKEKRIEEEIIGTFVQFPIKLAWAITVHKSQGLTFEKVIADLGGAFAPGQVYVALSRCTSFSGLVLKSRIERSSIRTDQEVLAFAQNEIPNTMMIQELTHGKADYYYQQTRKAIKNHDIPSVYENFTKALKYRNDIDTDTFRRYFTIHLTKYVSHSANLNKSMDKIKKYQELQEVFDAINDKQEKFIEQLEKENGKYKVIVKDLHTLGGDLKISNQKLESDLKRVKKQLNSSKRKTKILEASLIAKDHEIGQLKELKWYHKLFNAK